MWYLMACFCSYRDSFNFPVVLAEFHLKLLGKKIYNAPIFCSMNCVQEYIKSVFKDIYRDEFKKIKTQCSGHPEVSSCLSGEDDILWEYDGQTTADEEECEEILLEMQRIFYEDMRLELSKRGKFHPSQ